MAVRKRHIVASMLALAVGFAGLACACELPAIDGGDRHAHHGAPVSAASEDCAHADCDIDCGVDAVVERDKPVPAGKAVQDFAAAIAVSLPRLDPPVLSTHPPPRPWRPDGSPVRRYDRLLN